jgi:hypothetical protein
MTFLNNLVVLAAEKAADIPEGTQLTLSESLGVAVFCMAIVFAVLACLFLLIKAFSVGVRMIEARAVLVTPDADTGSASHQGSGTAIYDVGQLRLRDVDEPTAALVMAIVSDESGIPLSELCFKSIQKKS